MPLLTLKILTAEELDRLLYPVLPACLILLVILVVGVMISMTAKNKFRIHR